MILGETCSSALSISLLSTQLWWCLVVVVSKLFTFASVDMRHGQSLIAIKTLLAIVTITARGIMATVQANTARSTLGACYVVFGIETTPIRMLVTIACYMNICITVLVQLAGGKGM